VNITQDVHKTSVMQW